MVKIFLTFVLIFYPAISPFLSAQETGTPAEASVFLGETGDELIFNPDRDVRLALSTPDYPVTAGDVYTLAYLAGSEAVEHAITVDTNYRIRVSNLSVINAAGKTYDELKTQVESIVNGAYPLSGVQFVLRTPSVFKVQVKGEVRIAGEVSAWALARLSSLSGYVTPYGSVRTVTVISSNGLTRTYDLFKAGRLGDMTQNPYLRPNDTVVFGRVERQVTLEGAVERPGTYELLEGEQLKDLIEVYGSGFTPLAATERIGLTRLVRGQDKRGKRIYLSGAAVEENYLLENYDVVDVPLITAERPMVFIEGAVGTSASEEGGLSASNRLIVRFELGEDYGSLVRRNPDWFGAVSDGRNAYIERGVERIAIDLDALLYGGEGGVSRYLEPNDVLVIPFRQYFVTVSGAVINPGRYPYIPDRDWEYYVALAGGLRREQNSFQKVTIRGLDGRPMTKGDRITPETVITAESNAFLYHFNQVAPILSTTLTLILTVISLQTALSR
jgi:protein involved in polysaccharide export with SLBB domain